MPNRSIDQVREAEALIAMANRLADAAGAAIMPHFRSTSLTAGNKDGDGGFDPVTAGDRAGERAMRAILDIERPDDAILGEEEGTKSGTSGLTWVLDPIDGTRAFMSGLPTWGTLISVDPGDGPVMGVIDQPYNGERFLGGFGQAQLSRAGTTTNLRTRACVSLSDATLFSTFPEIGTPSERRGFEAVRDQVRLTRYGCDCYAYALIALGQIDLVIEAGLQAYDIQAPIAVIEAAGGVVTDWQGGKVHNGGRAVAAGDPNLHAQVIEIISKFV